jgi:hypothetical protein
MADGATGTTTRRDLLRKAGVGAVVMWVAPTVLSIGAVAAASSRPAFGAVRCVVVCAGESVCLAPCGAPTPGFSCGSCANIFCDTVATACGTSTGQTSGIPCLCAATVEGDCGCFNEVFSSGTVVCTTSADCVGVTPLSKTNAPGTAVGVAG